MAQASRRCSRQRDGGVARLLERDLAGRYLVGILAVLGIIVAAVVLSMPRQAAAMPMAEQWLEEPILADSEEEAESGQLDEDPPEEETASGQLDENPPDEPQAGPQDRPRRPRFGRHGQQRRGTDGRQMPPGSEDKLHPGPQPVTPEMIDWAMEVIKAKLPEFHVRLERYRQEDPERFEQTMREVLPVVMEYTRVRDRDPEVAETIVEEFKIEARLRELSRTYRREKGDPEERARIEEEIERLVGEQLELRFRRQAALLEDFHRRLQRQQERLERRRARLNEEIERRDELVAQRVAEVKMGKMRDGARRLGRSHRGRDEGLRGGPRHGPCGKDRLPRGPHGEEGRFRHWPEDEDNPPADGPDRPPPSEESEDD
ncbi:MAG: hypothetical protein JXQ75_19985 [Phycisphaerae bacterium]|nr:hypothetical protein [Phycisphaerae bacterium]